MKLVIFLLIIFSSIDIIYSQCESGNCVNGKGKYVWPDGTSYNGEWLNGAMTGKGTYKWANGYEKTCFVGDCKTGFGVMVVKEPDGAKSYYRGQFENGKRNGQGEEWSYSSSGSAYSYTKSVYKNDYPNGEYLVLSKDGKSMTLYDDENSDLRVISSINSVESTKPCEGNCINGYGKKVYSSYTYEGNWINSQWNGNGVYTNFMGDNYTGEFKDFKFHGRGEYIWGYGQKYEGMWYDGKRNGNGIYYYLDGDKYEGSFIDNNRTGWGKYTYEDGTFEEGNWENNIYKGNNSNAQTTTNNTTTTQTSNTNNKVESTSSCLLKFSRITGMTYSFTDNREKCCFCEKSYAKYSLNSSYQKDEEILLIGELLHLHLHDATEEHKKNDIERCQKFISDNFDAISAFSFPIMFELMGIHFMDSALKGGNFGQTHRKVNKYKFENKFCTNECESKCNYYGCKSCN